MAVGEVEVLDQEATIAHQGLEGKSRQRAVRRDHDGLADRLQRLDDLPIDSIGKGGQALAGTDCTRNGRELAFGGDARLRSNGYGGLDRARGDLGDQRSAGASTCSCEPRSTTPRPSLDSLTPT